MPEDVKQIDDLILKKLKACYEKLRQEKRFSTSDVKLYKMIQNYLHSLFANQPIPHTPQIIQPAANNLNELREQFLKLHGQYYQQAKAEGALHNCAPEMIKDLICTIEQDKSYNLT